METLREKSGLESLSSTTLTVADAAGTTGTKNSSFTYIFIRNINLISRLNTLVNNLRKTTVPARIRKFKATFPAGFRGRIYLRAKLYKSNYLKNLININDQNETSSNFKKASIIKPLLKILHHCC